jgi:hypothetical protein
MSKSEPISEAQYKKAFGIDPLDEKLLENALDHALDIRKFEIDLYWRRAAYFWALIAAAFAGYFLIMGSEQMPDKKFMAFVVSCVGFVFTFAWFQVNRGSKRWQENWENHVDMLEDRVTGPLYKTRLERPDSSKWFERAITGPTNISVSKTNQIVSLFTLFIWTVLAYAALEPVSPSLPVSVKTVFVLLVTLGFCGLMSRGVRSWEGDYLHDASLRKTRINSDF